MDRCRIELVMFCYDRGRCCLIFHSFYDPGKMALPTPLKCSLVVVTHLFWTRSTIGGWFPKIATLVASVATMFWHFQWQETSTWCASKITSRPLWFLHFNPCLLHFKRTVLRIIWINHLLHHKRRECDRIWHASWLSLIVACCECRFDVTYMYGMYTRGSCRRHARRCRSVPFDRRDWSNVFILSSITSRNVSTKPVQELGDLDSASVSLLVHLKADQRSSQVAANAKVYVASNREILQ
jgi:hypothetical protein